MPQVGQRERTPRDDDGTTVVIRMIRSTESESVSDIHMLMNNINRNIVEAESNMDSEITLRNRERAERARRRRLIRSSERLKEIDLRVKACSASIRTQNNLLVNIMMRMQTDVWNNDPQVREVRRSIQNAKSRRRYNTRLLNSELERMS